jgi:hypothetical protein
VLPSGAWCPSRTPWPAWRTGWLGTLASDLLDYVVGDTDTHAANLPGDDV